MALNRVGHRENSQLKIDRLFLKYLELSMMTGKLLFVQLVNQIVMCIWMKSPGDSLECKMENLMNSFFMFEALSNSRPFVEKEQRTAFQPATRFQLALHPK